MSPSKLRTSKKSSNRKIRGWPGFNIFSKHISYICYTNRASGAQFPSEMYTYTRAHYKMQSEKCRFGNKCRNYGCALVHPMKNILDNIDQEPRIAHVRDEKSAEVAEAEFIENSLHLQHIAELTDGIVYTRQLPAEPYEIETYPELGTFATWDDAYETLIDHIFSCETSDTDMREVQEMEEEFARLMAELDNLIGDDDDN
jgi:hypothetical protein